MCEGFLLRCAEGCTARVGVLDDDTRMGRFWPFFGGQRTAESEARVGVGVVVVGHRFAALNLSADQGRSITDRSSVDKQSGRLMRIFAVSKHLTLGCSNADDRRQAVGLVLDALHGLRRPNPTLVKGSGDGRVVARSLLEGFQRQGLAQVKADGFRRGCGPQGIEHVRVAFWPYHNQDVSVVLRRGPHEGGASDVDHFEEFGFGERWLFCCCLGKGVEVDRHHLNGGIAEFLQVSSVVFSLQTSKERAVNGGVKRLHTPVEDLRMARGLRHVRDRQPRFTQGSRGAAGGQEFEAQIRKTLCERDDVALVPHAKQGAWPNGLLLHGLTRFIEHR